MSSDTAKENASVVDSSVTEWKNDTENLDDPESPSYRRHEDVLPSAAEQGQSCDQMGKASAIKSGKLYGTRYFIMKSLNHENIQLSVERGIWATQVMNEPILEEAFHNSGKVILIFSVNMSGFFQGFAEMMSSIGWRRDSVWNRGTGGNNPWGHSFRVKWLRLHDLAFQKTLHLRNPLNGYKPVKISRDCQELPQDIGEALCDLFDGKDDVDVNFKMDVLTLKRPCLESPNALQSEDYSVSPLHMGWPQTPMLYSSLFHQHYQAEAIRFRLRKLPLTPGAAKLARTKQSRTNRSLGGLQLDQDDSSRLHPWGLSAERSPLASTLTEDNILDMSYEEYLEAHSQCNKQLYRPVVGPQWGVHESTSIEQADDLHSCHRENKRKHHSSIK